MEKTVQIYEGKAKKVYATTDEQLCIVSYKDDATAFNGQKKGTILGKGVINNKVTNHLMQMLEEKGIRFEHIPSGIDAFSLVIADKELEGRSKQVVNDLMKALDPDSIEVHDNMALIATVGRGMVSTIGTAARLFTALAQNGVNVRMIDQGASELNIIVGVESDDFAAAVNAIYQAFAE